MKMSKEAQFALEATAQELFDMASKNAIFGNAVVTAACNLIAGRAIGAPDPIGRLDEQLKLFNSTCEQSFVINSNSATGQHQKRKYDA